MIPQPKLGDLIVQLRKEKGWTQEELVEQCHVSVRTIQRIESGEVTPRFITIKILLAALDYDLERWKMMNQEKEDNNRFTSNPILKMLSINVPTDHIKKSLSSAWIAGMIFFVLFAVEIASEFTISEPYTTENKLVLTSIKLMIIASFFIFNRGFISLGILFENSRLKQGTYFYIAAVTIMYLGDIVIMYGFPESETVKNIFDLTFLLILGAAGLVFGMGLLKLQDGMGEIAKAAGILEVTIGICYLTLIFSFFGILLIAPVLILEILLLHKADELVKSGKL
jgi:transcriptional regulator with XRE-family HTH domain